MTKKYSMMLFPVNNNGEIIEKETDLQSSLKVNTETLDMKVQGKDEKLISSVELCEVINNIRKSEGIETILSHNDFMKKIRLEFDIIDEKEIREIFPSSYLDSMNREKPCYLLNKKQALQMVVSESKKVRSRLIDELERLYTENKQLKQKIYSYQVEDEIERAKLWIKEQEEKNLIIQEKNEKINVLENKIEEDKKYVDFGKSIEDNKQDTIDFGEFAKTMNIGRNKLFKKCRELNILMENNIPYQTYLNSGYFKNTLIERNGYLINKTLLTGKGVVWLSNKLGE